uniref:Rab-GAP TBC domain-containing protein n=1 Tax=Gasterosteus aculeatus aculeatus TaxID=481459 RepID=A0AAQ4QHE2_GASAC
MSSAYKNRILEFKETLSEENINLKTLRELCFNGIPFEGGIRALCWKILLNYLPFDQTLWESFLKKQREVYSQFLKEMIIQPGIAKANMGFSREDVTMEDHPLNPNPDSRWNNYFKDNEILLQIDKDVRRLYPDMAFFQRPTEYPCQLILDPQNEYETLRRRVEQTTLKAQTVNRNRSGVTNVSSPGKAFHLYPSNEYEVLPNGSEAHWEVVERILFIYAKLNPGIAYVQGMNEIVGPIYYTFATDPNSQWKEHAEADTFFCFTNLMSENRDNFIKSLDDSQCGITYKMESVYSMLKDKDLELFLKLEEQNIKPQYFTFRWLTLLLSQEFLLPDVIRIWDTLFSDQDRFHFLILTHPGQSTGRRLHGQHEVTAGLPHLGCAHHPDQGQRSAGQLLTRWLFGSCPFCWDVVGESLDITERCHGTQGRKAARRLRFHWPRRRFPAR